MKKKIITIVLLITMPIALFAYSNMDFKNLLILNNQDIAKASYTAELAEVDVDDAKAGFYPKIELLVTGTYMVNPLISKIVVDSNSLIQEATGITGIGAGPITIFKGMENTLYNAEITMTQPLFTWGKLSKGVDIYKKVALVRKIQKSSLIKQLESTIEGRQAGIYYLNKMNKNLKERQELASQLVDYSKDAFEDGILIEQDYLDAKIKAQEIDMGLSKVNMELKSQIINLQTEVGLDSLNYSEIEYEPNESKMADLPNRNWNEMYGQATSPLRDSFHMLNLLKEVSEGTKDVATSSIYWKPDVALQLSIGYGGSRLPLVETDWYRKDRYKLNATLAIKTTLWDGGKKLNDIKRGEIKVDDSQVNINSAKSKILTTLNTALLQIQLDNSNIKYQELKVEVADSKIKTEKDIFESGYGSNKEVLEAELEKLDAKFKIIENQLDRATNYFTVKFLIGE